MAWAPCHAPPLKTPGILALVATKRVTNDAMQRGTIPAIAERERESVCYKFVTCEAVLVRWECEWARVNGVLME